MQKHIVLIDKNDFKYTKIYTNQFELSFEIINKDIVLPMIINFELINMIYKLNPNIFAYVNMETKETNETNETNINDIKEVNMSALLKDIFCELGLPQYYSSLNIKRVNTLSGIRFNCLSTNEKTIYPKDSECLPIEQIVIDFVIISNHQVKVNCIINLTDDHNLPQFTEKIIGNIIYNIFNKVKQFIENIAFNI